MQFESTRMYRVREVAEHFDVSVTTIYRAIESGQLDALKLGTGKGTLRVSGAAVAAYEQACTQAANDSLVTGAMPTTTTDQILTADSNGARTTQSARSDTQHQ
jgi:excisionase family DNA binding protein